MTDGDPFGWAVALAAGVGLAAASGFRVFVPLLGVSLAVRFAGVGPVEGFEWLAHPVATVALGVAVVVEVGAYLVPWLDNALDTVATPIAVVSGTLLTALMLGDVPPLVQWTLAVLAGGGTAGLVQVGTVATRGASTATTGGIANPIFSLAEAGLSGLLTVLALVVPLATLALLFLLVLWWRRRKRRRRADGGSGAGAALALGLLLVAGTAGCAGRGRPEPSSSDAGATVAADSAAADHEYAIPRAYLPPPGRCRIWTPGRPPAEQEAEHPIGRCSELSGTMPDGGWLLYRPTDDAVHVRVWQYGEDGRVLHQRIYDVETGEVVRHVAPAAG